MALNAADSEKALVLFALASGSSNPKRADRVLAAGWFIASRVVLVELQMV